MLFFGEATAIVGLKTKGLLYSSKKFNTRTLKVQASSDKIKNMAELKIEL